MRLLGALLKWVLKITKARDHTTSLSSCSNLCSLWLFSLHPGGLFFAATCDSRLSSLSCAFQQLPSSCTRHTMISEECAPADSCGQRWWHCSCDRATTQVLNSMELQDWALSLPALRHLILLPNMLALECTQIVMLVHHTTISQFSLHWNTPGGVCRAEARTTRKQIKATWSGLALRKATGAFKGRSCHAENTGTRT